jgi:hypothetical protein
LLALFCALEVAASLFVRVPTSGHHSQGQSRISFGPRTLLELEGGVSRKTAAIVLILFRGKSSTLQNGKDGHPRFINSIQSKSD